MLVLSRAALQRQRNRVLERRERPGLVGQFENGGRVAPCQSLFAGDVRSHVRPSNPWRLRGLRAESTPNYLNSLVNLRGAQVSLATRAMQLTTRVLRRRNNEPLAVVSRGMRSANPYCSLRRRRQPIPILRILEKFKPQSKDAAAHAACVGRRRGEHAMQERVIGAFKQAVGFLTQGVSSSTSRQLAAPSRPRCATADRAAHGGRAGPSPGPSCWRARTARRWRGKSSVLHGREPVAAAGRRARLRGTQPHVRRALMLETSRSRKSSAAAADMNSRTRLLPRSARFDASWAS